MSLRYTFKLGLKACSINFKAQKIDGSIFDILEIVLASFQVEIKLGQAQYFQKRFLLADTNIGVILKILFLIFSNVNI